MSRYFIAGTDTDAGKSLITASCLYGLNAANIAAVGYKPIAAGAVHTPDGLVNNDAELLARYSAGKLKPTEINPVCFEPPIAPHIAAQKVGQAINMETILNHLNQLEQRGTPDLILIEGAGGWKVPIDLTGNTLADLPKEQRWPVILVVGMKLGCLNHALLTADAMISDGVNLAGWIANCIDPNMSELQANIESLQNLLPVPCLGVVPHLPEAKSEQAWPFLKEGVMALMQRYQAPGKACSKSKS